MPELETTEAGARPKSASGIARRPLHEVVRYERSGRARWIMEDQGPRGQCQRATIARRARAGPESERSSAPRAAAADR